VHYPLRMANGEPFDLPAFMLSRFNRVDLGVTFSISGQLGFGSRSESSSLREQRNSMSLPSRRPMSVSSYLKTGLRVKRS
jgi:hypothetical protein